MEHTVSFPALGWTFPVPQEFSLFGVLNIHYYGLLIACGFLLAVIYAYRRAPQFSVDPERMIDVVLVCTVVGVLCARLYYVFFYDAAGFLANPSKILAIWDGGLAIYGGVIGAFVGAMIVCRIRKVNTLAMFDLGSLGFLIGQSIGRWGNFFNQEAYGCNTDLPWGMTGDVIRSGVHGAVENQQLPVHPTFLYESLWCALGFVLLHILSKKRYRFHGQIFAGYLIWYGAGRALIEGLRSDSLYIGALKVSQLLAIVSVVAGIALLFVFRGYAAKKREAALCAQSPASEDPALTEREIPKDACSLDTAEQAVSPDSPQTAKMTLEEETENGKNH